MTAIFPGDIKSFAPVIDNFDVVEAANINPVYEEITSIETWLERAMAIGYHSRTAALTTDTTLSDTDYPIQYLDPTTDEFTVSLPSSTDTNHIYFIRNTNAAVALSVLSGTDEVVSVGAETTAIVVSDGATWSAISGGSGSTDTVTYSTTIMDISDTDTAGTTDAVSRGDHKHKIPMVDPIFWDSTGVGLRYGTGLTVTSGSLVATGGGSSLTTTDISPTTDNLIATVNYRYFANISGLTADRYFILPAGSIGDEIELCITTGDASYEYIIKGDTDVTINGGSAATEWSRLLISGEYVRFVANSASNWQVAVDGRIPCVCRIESDTGQNFSTATLTQITYNKTAFDNASIADLANEKIIIRRANKYILVGSLRFNTLGANATRIAVWITTAGTTPVAQFAECSGLSGAVPGIALVTLSNLATTDYISGYGYQTSGNTVGSNDAPYPHLAVFEVLT